nr:MAG TPA: hypothetical protein [Caudoviricetes sp.]
MSLSIPRRELTGVWTSKWLISQFLPSSCK